MQDAVQSLLLIAAFAPLFSAIVLIFLGHRLLGAELSGWFATVVNAIGFACAVGVLFIRPAGHPPIVGQFAWIPLPGMDAPAVTLGILADGLTVAGAVLVTGISTLVHLYSIGYMHGDKRFPRFFAFLSLFTFSMMGIIISHSLLQVFIFWELVGLTSYLLIGFWIEKKGPQLACTKAFLMNRIGDAGFLTGMGILFAVLGGNLLLPGAEGAIVDAKAAAEQTLTVPAEDGSLVLQSIAGQLTASTENNGLGIDLAHAPWWLTLAGIGLFCGAIGKSAQFPLHTWLPDAMEGPTPVSSIVHSATMVAAGVFFTARIFPILTPEAHLFIAAIGAITLVLAACMALVMTDIKKVLAYSTLSQLGYMVLALGAGAYTFALFHLITHAFFKCCLFQCAGSVIHAAHHEQDMRKYGGLGRKMPVTMLCFGICTLAIAGVSIPFTSLGVSGFYSKDGIIAGVFNYTWAMNAVTPLAWLFAAAPVVVAFITPFYMMRAFALTFLGRPRDQNLYDNAHEAPLTMLTPQLVLATMAVISGWFLWQGLIVETEPLVGQLTAGLQPAEAIEHHSAALKITHAVLLQGFAALLMLALGWAVYGRGLTVGERLRRMPGLNLLHTWAQRKFYFDVLYDIVIVNAGKLLGRFALLIDNGYVDGMVNGAAKLGLAAGQFVGRFDLKAVDRIYDGLAEFAQQTGELVRLTQVGRVRAYILLVFITLLAAASVAVGVVIANAG